MANSFKNTGWIFLLIAAGGIILFLSLNPNKPQGDQGVVLNDIFHPASVPATPVPPLVIQTTPADRHDTGFTIQVYSFQDKNRAQAALQALKSNGYQAFVVETDGKNKIWYRVRVGGIADETAAHKMLNDIRKNYNSGFILKTIN